MVFSFLQTWLPKKYLCFHILIIPFGKKITWILKMVHFWFLKTIFSFIYILFLLFFQESTSKTSVQYPHTALCLYTHIPTHIYVTQRLNTHIPTLHCVCTLPAWFSTRRRPTSSSFFISLLLIQIKKTLPLPNVTCFERRDSSLYSPYGPYLYGALNRISPTPSNLYVSCSIDNITHI